MSGFMKALYVQKKQNDCYEFTERPIPKAKPGEVVIRVGACGICHTDIIIRKGKALHPIYPFIPGHEFAGTIVEIGEGVKNRKIGERGGVMQVVTCHACRNCLMNRSVWLCDSAREMGSQRDGAFAEYCAVPAENFVPISDNISFEEAAMAEPLANAIFTIEMAEIQPNDTVVVIGPGPIGILCAKVAELYNSSKVILVGTRDGRLEIAKTGFGVKYAVNIRKKDAEKTLMEMLGGKGADVVVEAAGTQSALELAMRIHAANARIVLEGSPDYEETIPFNRLHLQPNARLIDITTWRRTDYSNALRYIREGRIDIRPLMTQKFSLEDWAKGFDLVENHKDECLKVIICP